MAWKEGVDGWVEGWSGWKEWIDEWIGDWIGVDGGVGSRNERMRVDAWIGSSDEAISTSSRAQ